MTAYALALVHSVEFGPEIVEYLQRIDATLDPFGGRFVVHGGNAELLEGSWDDIRDVILIEFPDDTNLRAWYASPAYQEILPLRTRNMNATAVILTGVPAGYRGVDSLDH
ncbi:DUF1330 domain-containing protein [Streptacidiphilus fuscans]|uniref:DUF1330 domain-containing protein n=1 Tax=Streptacidiphilus fuscans TaxID=2789292 RepID=A0A931B3Q6_9ACTN|nr:DUF1330 domain-containing protein [Streptacidiphilus fuscans]MBF9069686.1 DUF1330 domain-containing protein [Streptacidiphilus fuscans]